MPAYAQKALKRIQHISPPSPQYSPQHHNSVNYSSRSPQVATAIDTSPYLDPKNKKGFNPLMEHFYTMHDVWIQQLVRPLMIFLCHSPNLLSPHASNVPD